MGFTPIQFFRKEDFPELSKEKWTDKMFSKLNELARQTQYNFGNNITVEQNICGFWWDSRLVVTQKASGVIYPYTETSPAAPAKKQSANTSGFPFFFANKMEKKVVKSVSVAQAIDVTNAESAPVPTMLFGVAWEQRADSDGTDGVKVYGIGGALVGRIYDLRLLVLCE